MRFRTPRVTPSIAISAAALFVALGGSAYAATGGNFLLGSPNSADQTTSLSSTAANGAALSLTNNQTGTKATALNLTTDPSRAPFTTNSATRVKNLNADSLDGISSTGFINGHGNANSSVVSLPFTSGAHQSLTLGLAHITVFCDNGALANAVISVGGQTDQTDTVFWNGVDRMGPTHGFATLTSPEFVGFNSEGGSNDHGTTGTVFLSGTIGGQPTTTVLTFGGGVDPSETSCSFQFQAQTARSLAS